MNRRRGLSEGPAPTPGSHADGAGGGAAVEEWTPAGIVARLDALVRARDAGDLRRAAARCGVSRAALARLAAGLRALAPERRRGPGRAAGVLAAVARGYRVDATWLVTGAEDFHGERLAPAARLQVAALLQAVGQRILRARRSAVPQRPGDPV
jgi:hypothetical protein